MSEKDRIRLSSQYWQRLAEECEKEKESLESRCSELETENQRLKSYTLKQLISSYHNFWLQRLEPYPSTLQFIDPIYEHLELDEALSKLFLTPFIQRLSRVRQLSFSYINHPLAQHSRLAHSLGVYKNMELVLTRMIQQNKLYTSRGIEDFSQALSTAGINNEKLVKTGKALALLHDIGHGPFGHALDRYVAYRLRKDMKGVDKEFSVNYIKTHLTSIINEIGLDPEYIAKILSPNKEKLTSFDCLLADLIDSPIDLDRLDFLVRDAHTTGLQIGFINPKLIMDCMVPYKDSFGNINLAFKEQALPFVEHFLYARSIMYARCYEEDTKAAAEGMLVLAIMNFLQEMSELDLSGLMLLDDETLLNLLLTSGIKKVENMAKLLKLGVVYVKVFQVHKKQSQKLIDYIMKDVTRRPSTALFELPFSTWPKAIAEGAKINYDEEGWKILVIPPSPNVYREVEVDINILYQRGNGFDIKRASEVSPLLEDTQRIIQQSQQIVRVFVHPSFNSEKRNAIVESAKSFFEEK